MRLRGAGKFNTDLSFLYLAVLFLLFFALRILSTRHLENQKPPCQMQKILRRLVDEIINFWTQFLRLFLHMRFYLLTERGDSF